MQHFARLGECLTAKYPASYLTASPLRVQYRFASAAVGVWVISR
jgi:hypothetical protein